MKPQRLREAREVRDCEVYPRGMHWSAQNRVVPTGRAGKGRYEVGKRIPG